MLLSVLVLVIIFTRLGTPLESAERTNERIDWHNEQPFRNQQSLLQIDGS